MGYMALLKSGDKWVDSGILLEVWCTSHHTKMDMTKRVEIDDGLHDLATSLCPKYLSVTGFINLILDQHLDSGCRLPAYRVGAGERVTDTSQPSLQQPSALEVNSSQAKQMVDLPSESFENPSLMDRLVEKGGSRGKEEEGETSKSDLKPVPLNLSEHETLIHEFWRCKKGSKNSRAWSLLLTELTKIQDEFGPAKTEEQLMLGINGLWKGITVSNLRRFEPVKKPWQKEPEMKHPAHRDFTAERLEAERKEREAEEQHNFLGL